MLTVCAHQEWGHSDRKLFAPTTTVTGDYPSNGVRRRTQEWAIELPSTAENVATSGGSDPFMGSQPTVAGQDAIISLLPLVEEDDDELDEQGQDDALLDEFDGTLPVGSSHIRYPGVCRRMAEPQVPTLKTQRIWRSKRQRVYSDVSIVTQLSIQRLDMLRAQCSGVWGSVISAAVHVPVMNGLVLTEASIDSKADRSSLGGHRPD